MSNEEIIQLINEAEENTKDVFKRIVHVFK